MDSQKVKKAKRIINKPYATWSYEERIKLLQTRIRLNHLFTGKNSNSSTGWKQVVEECQFGPEKTFLSCKQQWCGLMKKYKSFFKLNTGDGAGDEAPEEKLNREDWPYFEIIHQYANLKDNYHPSYLLSNSRGVYRRPIGDQNCTTEATVITSPTPSTSRGSYSSDLQSFSPTPSTSRGSDGDITAFSPTPSTSRGSDGDITAFSPTPSTSRGIDSDFQTFSPTPSTSRGSGNKSKQNLSSHEKYFKKRDRRLEKKINALLAVFGQLVKIQHPNINVDALLISSESEDSDE